MMSTAYLFCEQEAMAKGRPSRKEPDAWDTACQITNTVLEVAKVWVGAGSMHTGICRHRLSELMVVSGTKG